MTLIIFRLYQNVNAMIETLRYACSESGDMGDTNLVWSQWSVKVFQNGGTTTPELMILALLNL